MTKLANAVGAEVKAGALREMATIALGAALAVGIVVVASVNLVRLAEPLAVIWPANAIVVVCGLIWPRRRWAAVGGGFVGNVAANLLTGSGYPAALGLAGANAVEITIVLILVSRRLGDRLRFSHTDHIRTYRAAALLGSAASAVLSAGVAAGYSLPAFEADLLVNFLAHAAGLIALVPCVWILLRPSDHERGGTWGPREGVAVLLVIGLTLAVFAQTSPLLFIVPIGVLVLSLTAGPVGAVVSSVIVTVIALAATLSGFGPLAALSLRPAEATVALQLFVGVMTAMALQAAAIRHEQLKILAAARDSETRYRMLSDNSVDIIARFDRERRFTYVSPSVERILGYRPEELIGRSTADVMSREDHEASLRFYREQVDTHVGDDGVNFEWRGRRKDGGEVWLSGRPRALLDPSTGELLGYQDIVRDITARKTAEAALQVSEQRLSVVANTTHDIISRSRINGELIYASPAIERVTGYTLDELREGRPPLAPLVHPDDIEPATRHIRSIIRGELPDGTPMTYRLKRKDGAWIWLSGHPTVFRDPEGRPLEIIDVLRDTTAEQSLQESLEHARAAAEAAVRVKTEFMANMSHEIRTPLTAVIGYANLLQKSKTLSDADRRHVERVETAGETLLAIVNDILDFSRLEAGGVVIKPRPVELGPFFDTLLSIFAVMAQQKGLDLRFEPRGSLPNAIEIDPDRLRQILINLVGNALKFTSVGGVTVAAAYDPAEERLAIDVIDTGAGLSEEGKAKLFVRFSQVDGSSTREHGGTGLGLAICKGLVEAMGGRLGVESVLGQGATFSFELPAKVAAPAPRASDAEPAAPLQGLRLLIVDDNPANRDIAQRAAEEFGAQVETSPDGTAALSRLAQWPFDVVLLDRRMPGLSGEEVLQRLRSSKGLNSDVPVLAFSADLAGDVFREGYDGAVRKPLEVRQFLAAVLECEALSFDSEPAA